MSQLTKFDPGSTPGTPDVQFIEGNTGGAVGPNPATFIINVTGDTVQGVHVNGTAGTYTEVITVDDATTLQKGVVLLADNAETIAGTNTTKATTPDDIKAKLGAQTLHGIPYGNATTGAVQWLAEGTDGQIPIGDTGGVPILGNITSLNGSIAVTNGPGTIDIKLSNSFVDQTQTIGAVTNTITTIPLTLPGTYTFEVRVSAWEIGGTAGKGFSVNGVARSNGVAATLISDADGFNHSDTALDAADVNLDDSGINILVRVTGVAGLTVNWGAITVYVFRGA